ncbi:MAG: lytic transglycosylase domain-containing protein [Deltaproteobacteria bacterium]|nr:lytic transglycosylase domain-containing protein [Deltaproteobacteria bacterium]
MDALLARARALYGALRNTQAEQAYTAAAQATRDPAVRCQANFMRAKATLRRRARSEGAERMQEVAATCAGDLRARALYAAARAHSALGERPAAIRLYRELERVAPDHRLADDAYLRTAIALRGAGDEASFLRMLAEMPERYPHGDMTPDALFQLGVFRLGAGDAQAALAAFEALSSFPEDTAEDALGRPGYWRGRALAALGRGPEAASAYVRVATHFPLAYYAQLAMSRLAELDRAALERVEARLSSTRVESPLRFPRRPEMNTPAFARLLSLLRVGDLGRAEIELEAQGFLGEGADPDALWLAAALLAEAGDLARATTLSRRRLSSFRRVTPVGPGRAFWRLAYPRAFAPLIEQTATRARVPASLVRAIAREESGFDPGAVSWAHAYGLVQVILPTARRFGRPLGLTITPRTLRQADTNLQVGTRFMRFLLDRYDDNPGLIPAAYNAGHNAADRWLRARPELPLDEWVEAIPYAETRRYTRRVLQSYGVYRFLDAHELPLLALSLPQASGS